MARNLSYGRSVREKRKRRFDAFVSHSTMDFQIVEGIVDVLESHRIRCWYAPRDIPAGVAWARAVVDAIGASRMMIFVSSAHSNKSPMVEREIGHGAGKGITILPIRIDRATLSKEMKFFISSYHWLDATARPFEQHHASIVKAARSIIAGTCIPG